MNQLNPFCTLTFLFLKIHFNIKRTVKIILTNYKQRATLNTVMFPWVVLLLY